MDQKLFSLLEFINRKLPPLPWGEGDNIPWHDPEFSSRMLQEHLSQQHDAASRRLTIIDQHIEFIHNQILKKTNTNILDLGCGPGFYTSRLATIGHKCTGIDFSPASIVYAQQIASEQRLNCTYIQADIRKIKFGDGFDLIMLLFGEFNVFPQEVAEDILWKAFDALNPGGILLLEPQKFSAIEKMGRQSPIWYASAGGLFSEKPHLVLTECFWNALGNNATVRYYVQEANNGLIARYAQTFQAYTSKEYDELICKIGFNQINELPSLEANPSHTQDDYFVITALKPNS